ncbi:uncharacterized protein SCHCODRAFT_02515268 [Schizophyllum commune H4-8]|nr:uncharacterized protein SCHCODRAFT_02515268 [Schizophyllum commune H4-8]KAI5887969.1 hypothetical protein SCHCODRAFT_02515268 [Schizophyllum commune H4-8]
MLQDTSKRTWAAAGQRQFPDEEDRALLDDLIKENGSDKVKDYISRNFTPTVIKIRRITPENAHEWIDLSAFAAWLVEDCQKRLRGPTPPRDPAPPDVEKQRGTDVQQPRPTEVQQSRTTEVQQPQAESTPRPPSLPLSMYRQFQKRDRPSYLEDVAAHPESDDPLTTGDSGARESRNRKRQHTSFFDEEDSRQASSSQNSRLTTSIGHSGSSQDTDKAFDVVGRSLP